MRQANDSPAHGQAQRLRNLVGGNTHQRCFFFVHHKAILRLGGLHGPIYVHHARSLLEFVANLPRKVDLLAIIRAVDFRHQRLIHRRAGGNFRHFQFGPVFLPDGHNGVTHALRDIVALGGAIVLGKQVYLNVSLVRALPQEVVTHQSIEVIRTGRACVHLVIDDLRFLGYAARHLTCHSRRLFECRPFRHVDDHLELALVVEGKHLDAYNL